MSKFARQRQAARKAAQNAATIRPSVQTMTARTMLAARQAGENAVMHSAGLSGTSSLKTVMPHGFNNPLSLHWADSHLDRLWKRDIDARNPIDHDAIETARLDCLMSILRAERLVK